MDSLSTATQYALQAIAYEVEERQVYAYNTLSDIYHAREDAEKVIEYAEKCIPLAEKHGPEEELLKAYDHASESLVYSK